MAIFNPQNCADFLEGMKNKTQTREDKIKVWLKSWKYLDEALDFAKKANCPIDEAEIIRCNSTGLAIFNPQNCADYLESMKNKEVSREDKLLSLKKYNEEHAQK